MTLNIFGKAEGAANDIFSTTYYDYVNLVQVMDSEYGHG